MSMIKGTPELIAERREEILTVCERLYETMNFKDVTLKEIGKETSFSRPTIYNYFESKEEIFLALFEREYALWSDELEELCGKAEEANRMTVAEWIAESLQKRKLLLKLLSVNLHDMEENSRRECLVSFKRTYGKARETLTKLIRTAFPNQSPEEVQSVVLTFLAYMHGVYPYVFATEKQIDAMDEVGIAHPDTTIKDLVCTGLMRILS